MLLILLSVAGAITAIWGVMRIKSIAAQEQLEDAINAANRVDLVSVKVVSTISHYDQPTDLGSSKQPKGRSKPSHPRKHIASELANQFDKIIEADYEACY